jgi:hypothetical protein
MGLPLLLSAVLSFVRTQRLKRSAGRLSLIEGRA